MIGRQLLSKCIFILSFFFLLLSLKAQAYLSINYYLPDSPVDDAIPTPESVLGHQVGEWHVSHDKLVHYLQTLADASDRIVLKEYARSYENRPLFVLLITAEDNHKRLEKIRENHLSLCDPASSGKINTSKEPVVVYQGYSIHGNESSGGNAALLMAYHLAASQSKETKQLLEETVILLDPCMNPDGFHRFSTWVNMHKSKNLVSDPNSREFDEVWPGGRTNHYWFDLNRDWLLVQHPESRGRIQLFQSWKPNLLTDHHEMGTNSTYFFMPGVQSRTNPLTPPENQDLTFEIAKYHAKALDEIGSLYYTEESFDDYYYGKGSTYPDANGCIGILFEQASSRGHLQESINGPLSFPFTIRNQVTTSFSTLKAAHEMREKLLNYQKKFFELAFDEAKKDAVKAYVFNANGDQGRLEHFLDLLSHHDISVFRLSKKMSTTTNNFEATNSYIIPLDQPQYRLIKGMFETRTSFTDSLFYDVSTWTLPLAFNLQYSDLGARVYDSSLLGEKVDKRQERERSIIGNGSYGYLFEWKDYYAPKLLNQILEAGYRAKVATKPLQVPVDGRIKSFSYGTVFVPGQPEVKEYLEELVKEQGLDVYAINSGLTPEGIDLGSSSFRTLENLNVLMVVGSGVRSYDAGEVWHLLDQRFNMRLTMVDVDQMSRVDLKDYNRIILVSGYYNSMGSNGTAALRDWVRSGGVLIGMREALNWMRNSGLANFETKRATRNDNGNGRRPYIKQRNDSGARVVGGAIVEGQMDRSHPLCYGYERSIIPLFKKGTMAIEVTKNNYATPIIYSDRPLLSGYMSAENEAVLGGAAAAFVCGTGSGKVICIVDNPNFRAFWFGTNKLFMNALFFGDVISSRTVERVGE